MTNLLISWIGRADLSAADAGSDGSDGLGPIAQALVERCYDSAILISDYPKEDVAPFLDWLRPRAEAAVTACYEPLTGPTQFGEIYEAAVRVLDESLEHHGEDARLTFHLSPGTPAMAAVWIILAKTRFPAELIESSPRHGVQTASVPFDISAEFLPDLLRGPDERLRNLTAGLPPDAPEFADIIHRSDVMARVIAKARRVAPRSVPVLIEGESGTGKELFARAIHRASPRRDGPFQAVNCGAIPAELVESELFGHEKGAFTGADRRRQGHFEAANGGEPSSSTRSASFPCQPRSSSCARCRRERFCALERRGRSRSMCGSSRRRTGRSPRRSRRDASVRTCSIGSPSRAFTCPRCGSGPVI